MTTHRLTILALAAAAAIAGLSIDISVAPTATGELISSKLMSEAHAIIGRPMTPLSYAGVARRTVRRSYYGYY